MTENTQSPAAAPAEEPKRSTITLTEYPDSNKVHAAGFDAERQRFVVQFKRRDSKGSPLPPDKQYEYRAVAPERYAEFLEAPSKGSFVHSVFVKTGWAFDRFPL